MGSTINPRARGGASLSGELKASRDDRQQIRRLTSAPVKPVPPVTGGSVIGNAEAYSETYAADAYGLVFQSWAFTTHDYWPGGGAPTLVASGSDGFDPVEPGWYIACAKVSVFVTGAPAYARIEVNGDSTSNTDATATDHRPFLDSGVRATVTTGPFYHPGPGVANHFLGVRVSWPGGGVAVSSASVSYMLARVA